jgi:hypothetical protein
MMTVAELRFGIEQMSESEIQTQYDQYCNLQARGVRDEIMLTMLEDELYNRTVLTE